MKTVNPLCHTCNKRTKSKGKNQGFECVKCKKAFSNKIFEEIPREIECRLYVPTLSAHRHLTRPIQRIGKLNNKIEFDNSRKWFHISKSGLVNQKLEIKINTRKLKH
jgi:tRNA(Ile2)-agmatinylcytidine synthase